MSAARWLLCLGLALAAAPEAQAEPGVVTITCDRTLQVLSPRALSSDRARKAALRQAAAGLGERSVDLAGVRLDAAALLAIADENEGEPLVRVSRELLRRPVDLDDLILFLDDLLAQQDRLQGVAVVLPPGRARSAGIILHPYDVFLPAKEKRYGEAMTEPLGLTSASRLAAGLTRLDPRKLTLDSDVTSLLRREVAASTAPVAAGATPGSPVPIQDRMARVQIVRGTATRAVAIGAIDLAAEADAAPAAD